MTKRRIFIGSSGASVGWARDIQQILLEEHDSDIDVQGWWRRDAFPIGTTTLDALMKALTTCDAALLVASPDDLVLKKGQQVGQPRDNVIFEYGLFCGAHGSKRTALAVLPDPDGQHPTLASDWDGVTRLELIYARPGDAFREANRSAILSWLSQLKETPLRAGDLRRSLLPETDQAMMELTREVQARPDLRQQLDTFAAEFLRALIKQSVKEGYGYDAMYAAMLKHNLSRCNSIYALDVLGPSAWFGPASFRYLSIQLWRYLRANATTGAISLTVSDALGDAIERAVAAATKPPVATAKPPLSESLTDFDTQQELNWRRGKPVMEYARLLRWSPEELCSPLAEFAIAIHEAFHVPLFFLATPPGAQERAFDYLLITEDEVRNIFGFVSHRPQFKPAALDDMKAGERMKYVRHFRDLLASKDLMFAVDARYYLTP